jgi:hypothetical protein
LSYFFRIGSENINVIWPKVKNLLQKAIDLNSGELEVDDIKTFLLQGDMQLWVVADPKKGIIAAGTTEIVIYPRQKRLRVVLLGAKKNHFRNWILKVWDKDSDLVKYAKDLNIDKFEISGRDGWLRYLSVIGFKKESITILKDVE